MNITRGNRKHAEAEPTDGAGSGTLRRRSVLGGLAAIPVLSGLAGVSRPRLGRRVCAAGQRPGGRR